MDVIRDLFTNNETLLLFIYGQVYFMLSISIVLRSHPHSRLELARTLPLLAAFGFTQALVKWGDVFIPIQTDHVPTTFISVLHVSQLFLSGLSFTFLLAFGLKVMTLRSWEPKAIRLLPPVIYLLWVGGVFVLWLFDIAPTDDIIRIADAISRYLLVLPGGLLAATGLYRQTKGTISSMGAPIVVTFLRAAAIALSFYALLTGVLVPPAPFFPANGLNQDILDHSLGIPAELFRALAGFVLTYSILQALKIFQIETKNWIDEIERTRALANDRERIGRELHDGTIQSIYAAGLILEDVRLALKDEPERAYAQLDRAMTSLNRTIQDIRSYIFDLRRDQVTENIETSLNRLIKDFRVNTLIDVNLQVKGKKHQDLEPDRVQNLYQIAQEALTNVARHAQACHVNVQLRYGEQQLMLRIADDGIGFPVSGVNSAGRGLKNMRERAQLLEGALVVEGTPNKGVTVVLTIPYATN